MGKGNNLQNWIIRSELSLFFWRTRSIVLEEGLSMVDQGKCESLRVYTPTPQHPCYNAAGKSSCRQNHSFKDISIILRTDSPSQAGSIFFDNHGGGQVQISNPLQLHFTVHAHWIIIYIYSKESPVFYIYIYIWWWWLDLGGIFLKKGLQLLTYSWHLNSVKFGFPFNFW